MWFQKNKQSQLNRNDIACVVESVISAKGYASGEALNEVFDKIVDIQHHLNCGAVCGHKPQRFLKIDLGRFLSPTTYIFECQQCGLQIRKTKSQLTQSERDALIELGNTHLSEPTEEKE